MGGARFHGPWPGGPRQRRRSPKARGRDESSCTRSRWVLLWVVLVGAAAAWGDSHLTERLRGRRGDGLPNVGASGLGRPSSSTAAEGRVPGRETAWEGPVSAYEREEAARRQEARYEGWGDPQAGPQVIWLDPHDLRGGGEPEATKKAQQQKRPPSRSAPGNNPECPSVREEACKVGGCPFKGTRDKLVHHLAREHQLPGGKDAVPAADLARLGNGHYEKVSYKDLKKEKAEGSAKEILWKRSAKAKMVNVDESPAHAGTIEGTLGVRDARWLACPDLKQGCYSLHGIRQGAAFFCPLLGCERSMRAAGGRMGPKFSSFGALKAHLDVHNREDKINPNVLSQLGLRECVVCGDMVKIEKMAHAACAKKLKGGDNPGVTSIPHADRSTLPGWGEVAHLRLQTRNSVPRPLHRLWAETLTRTLKLVNEEKSEASALLLYMLPKTCLGRDRGGRKAHNKNITLTRDRLVAWGEGSYSRLWEDAKAGAAAAGGKDRARLDEEEGKLARATTLTKMGRFSMGNAALVAEGLAEDNNTTWEALLSKHPKAAEHRRQEGPAGLEAGDPLSVPEDAVLSAIKEFPRGSGAGPSSLRAQFLKDAAGAPDPQTRKPANPQTRKTRKPALGGPAGPLVHLMDS
ncbi:hypothetical protein DIPPA_16967 [Diplonema papillatum]|nr:hypothetical protein DIPPA_16967 [Diplonema papillatum]